MISVKLTILLTVAAVVACVSSSRVKPTNDVTDENNVEVDGIPLKYLTEEELEDLLDEEDKLFATELDILVAAKIVKARGNDDDLTVLDSSFGVTPRGRQKRWIRTLFSTGRLLISNAVRILKTFTTGRNIIQHYQKFGTILDAINDFLSAKPDNARKSSDNGINVQTGTIGRHTLTLKHGGKQGAPTLEIRSPKSGGGVHIRIFMYR